MLKPKDAQSREITIPVEFRWQHSNAEEVYICGDFSNWQPVGLRKAGRRGKGAWEKKLMLQPGRYEYKFFVDGEWTHDPGARENVPNVYGSLNSVLEV